MPISKMAKKSLQKGILKNTPSAKMSPLQKGLALKDKEEEEDEEQDPKKDDQEKFLNELEEALQEAKSRLSKMAKEETEHSFRP
eukprot:s3728_g10.t1